DRVKFRLRSKLPAKETELYDPQIQAAGALVRMSPTDPIWSRLAGPIARYLVKEHPVYLGTWREVFQPISDRLVVPLHRAYADRSAPESRDHAFALLFEFAIQSKNKHRDEDLAALVW